MSEPPEPPEAFLQAVGRIAPALLRALGTLEQVGRHLHPPRIAQLREYVHPVRDDLHRARAEFAQVPAADGLERFAEQLQAAALRGEEALSLFCDDAPGNQAITRVLGAMRAQCRALEQLYPLRRALPPVARFFLEPACHARLDALDPETGAEARVGLLSAHNEADQRGGFSLFVPESCTGDEPRPLIVALHGGSGHGRDFLWTWLREAKSRRCLLLAPTSRGPTWSLDGPDLDARRLASMIRFVGERWPIDAAKVLLTGLSDGATYTLLCGLQEDAPFTALAPFSGVLHPANFANGNLGRVHGVPVYLVHGALDWMFPVQLARMAAEELEKAGAALEFRELADLSHTYPREENARILEWLDPALALPPPEAESA